MLLNDLKVGPPRGRGHRVRAPSGIDRIDASETDEGKLRMVDDVVFDECAMIGSTITPVPGGVGPMTIAMLTANRIIAAFARRLDIANVFA